MRGPFFKAARGPNPAREGAWEVSELMESMDRRASPRRPIDLAAQMHWEESAFPCRIADFCAEGLFLKFAAETTRQLEVGSRRPQPGRNLTVSFREPGGGREYQMAVRVARSVPNAIGVAFTRSDMDAIAAMMRLCGAEGEPEPPRLKPEGDKAQFILRQCAREIVSVVEPLMEDCLTRLVKDLRDASSGAMSDQQANELMDAAALLDARRLPFWHQMTLALEAPLRTPTGNKRELNAGELSLVDKGEFEDWLTIKVMVTKAETQYRGQLLPLRMRLDKAGIVNSTGTQNALGPVLICNAFRQVMQNMRLPRSAEKVCLRTFEERVLKSLADLYERLNQLLIHHGILPELDLSRYLADRQGDRSDPSQKSTPERSTPESSAPESKGAETKTNASRAAASAPRAPKGRARDRQFQLLHGQAQSAFATVRNLLGTLQSRRQTAAGGEAPQGGTRVSDSELGRQLQKLQQEAVQPRKLGPDSLRERVLERIRDGREDFRLDEAQQSSLDVVDEFFDSLSKSPRLGDFARDQVRKLEVPVLRMVLQDAQFFDNRSDPARAVLNRIAELGIKSARTSPVVQRRVESLVQRVNNEFDQDPRVFEEVQQELEALIERQNLVYRRNVERVTAAAEGAQKVEESKRAVAGELDQRLAGRRVPRAVLSLIGGGWRDLLSLTWIRQGPDSQPYQDYLAVVDTLLALAREPAAPVNLPELLRTIQEGLATVSSNQMAPGRIRDELKRFLMNRHERKFEQVEMPPAEEQPTDHPPASLDEARQRRLQRWINRVHRLQLGDWLRYQDDPSDPHHMRLVWIGRNQSRFVFVNHQGMKVVEMELVRLAEQMQQGIVIPDPNFEQPVVDESIDRMVKNVYDQLSWATTHDELTGLLGRREFERQLLHRLDRRELGGGWVLAQLDLRQFRLLNDTAGYSAGDEVLKQVAGLIRGTVADDQDAARLSGNEFVLLIAAADAEASLYTLVHRIEGLSPTFNGRGYKLSASVGVADNPDLLMGPEPWLKAAAEACALSKQKGLGRVHYQPADPGDRSKQEQIAARIAGLGSLDEERIMLRCQKIIPLHGGARLPAQFEVMIGLYDDRGQLISGADFVRMAERYNRMQAVDRWVVGHMLDWLRVNPGVLNGEGGVCIKLSGHSLNDQELLEFIYERLGQRDAPLERMWFEITEAAGISDLPLVEDFMQEVRELGCRFCLGNFGAGPTSYQLLRTLPVDMIKIDGAFIRDIVRSETDQAMVRSMVDLAHYMDREVIASQVEEKSALDLLVNLGVDYAQGYAIEKPRLLDSL